MSVRNMCMMLLVPIELSYLYKQFAFSKQIDKKKEICMGRKIHKVLGEYI